MPTVHQNYIKASNLLLLQLVIGLANYFLNYNDIQSRHRIIMPVVVIVFCSIIFFLIRTGTNWVKYFLLASWILVNSKPANWTAMFTHGIGKAMLSTVSIVIGFWILWLLFKIPNKSIPNKKGPDLSEPL
jgi:putative effector of murein hydrolase